MTTCPNPHCPLCDFWTLTVFQVRNFVKHTLLIQQSKDIESLINTGDKWMDDAKGIYYQIRPE